MERMRFARFTFVLICLLLPVTCYSQSSSPATEKRVAELIEKMVKEKSEHRAFADLEALGCSAVPAIIKHMDDRRELPDKNISLRNKSPDAWENMRYYGVERVVDALDAILNQMTGESFGYIDEHKDEPTKDAERAKVVRGWGLDGKNTRREVVRTRVKSLSRIQIVGERQG
jgi:hypothetical protein